MMQLNRLIEGLDLLQATGPAPGSVELSDLTDDSRQAGPGVAFVARSGSQADGRQYLADALRRGVPAVVAQGDPPADWPADVAWVRPAKDDAAVDQRLAGRIAEKFFGEPSAKLRLIGVTGTNGKTTTATLIQHLLNHAGVRCGLIGTVVVDEADPAGPRPATLTTPGAIDFSRSLARMVAHGCRAAVAEVSSHALHQGRVGALWFDVAVFTNLTGDHLDYHGTMDAYAAAKGLLFALLGEQGWAVINADDPHARTMARRFRGQAAHLLQTTLLRRTPEALAAELYESQLEDAPRAPSPMCAARVHELSASGGRVQLDGPWGSVEVTLPLVGRHNVSNALQAAAAAHAVVDVSRTLRQALASCPPVPGRLELVTPAAQRGALPAVLVDYAHTHDALENVLVALRPVTKGRLIVLFGCGGDRDKTKRPKMAQVACRMADEVWITSDNPRTEEPDAIIEDILGGVERETFSIFDFRFAIEEQGGSVPAEITNRKSQIENAAIVYLDADRARAIRGCILAADAADTVLLAGKGHEDYQIIGHEKRHFDDREHAAAALAAWHEQRSR